MVKSYLSNRTQCCCINGSLSDTLTGAGPRSSARFNFGPNTFLALHQRPSNWNLQLTCRYIYADDTTIWEINSDPLLIQRSLQDSLDRTGRWLSLNKMVPNTKKTKHSIIGTAQKLVHSGNLPLDLSLCGTLIEEAKDEKLLGVKIDKHLNWDNHNDFLCHMGVCVYSARTYLKH